MSDDFAETPFTREPTPAEQAVQRDFETFWHRVFHYGVHPWPSGFPALMALALITGWAWLVMSAFMVLFVWLICAGFINRAAWGRWYSALLNAIAARIFNARPYAHANEQANHADQLRETTVSLGLLATAQTEDTPEAHGFVADSRAGMENRLAALLMIPKPTREQHIERRMLERWLRQDRGDAPAKPQGFFGALPAVAGFSLTPWLFGGAAVLLAGNVTLWGLWRGAENEADTAERHMHEAQAEADSWHDRYVQQESALAAARASAEATATNIMEQRRRDAVNAAARRRIERDIATAIEGVGAPPNWEASAFAPPVAGDGVRDAGAGEGAAAPEPAPSPAPDSGGMPPPTS